MQLVKLIARFAGKYRWALILCPIVMIGEVVMEMLIPMEMTKLIDEAIPNAAQTGLGPVIACGVTMIAMAIVSMGFGIAGSRLGAVGGMGFAANLRSGIFSKIQKYSFSNIDKFSTSGLVTRLTTDVTNIQNAYQMLLRMCFRAPISLVFAIVIGTIAFRVVEFGGGMDFSVLKTIFQMLVGIVPGSLLQPFIDGNTLQIIFLALTSGIIILILDQQAKGVISFVNELSTIFMTAVTYFSALWKNKKVVLVAGIIIALAQLAVFKYFNFFSNIIFFMIR